MKLLTSAALAASLCITSVTPAIAENIVGSVKAWQYMQADGWKSADEEAERCYLCCSPESVFADTGPC
ncbi:hypothetical protein BR313_003552 [Escherichia coli]|nr:hypothetical protein [Escherichia coli]EJM9619659.1 hypothetical protein [Escherichia coli]